MKSNGLSFHHPLAFWFGCCALIAGVFAHMPMFLMASNNGYRMAGMPMDNIMLTGMALIPLGLTFAAYGLMPRLAQMQNDGTVTFHIADEATLNREHWKLVIVLFVALAVDVMKPATLGFVMPGMGREYEIPKQTAAWLALVALTGTTLGSVIWGRIADVFGRRAAILLSALMFMGTAICGAMPAFSWNLAMCFLMGASAGGLLPIAFTLMAEMIPFQAPGLAVGDAAGGVGTSAGYLLAAGSAATLGTTLQLARALAARDCRDRGHRSPSSTALFRNRRASWSMPGWASRRAKYYRRLFSGTLDRTGNCAMIHSRHCQ